MPLLQFDAELVRRYEGEGPRYTSYPTARQFGPETGVEDYRREAHHSNDDPLPRRLSLYLHLPFCESPCFYCGCNRFITRDPSRVAAYVQRLEHEISLQGSLFDRDREVPQLHLGGGTPTLLSDAQLAGLWRKLAGAFSLYPGQDREMSIEVDPRTVTAPRMRSLADIGFDRVSFGIQDFDSDVQAAVNRRQERDHCLRIMDAAKAAGFRSVAVDLIYGLPRQTLDGFGATLQTIVAAHPGRVAVYGYAHLPAQFKAQRQIDVAELPGPALRLELLALAVERLTAAGYEYIGLDHFALPSDSLARARAAGTLQRNFQGYSTHAGLDMVGLGVSAIGRVGNMYAQNAKTLNDYYGAVDSDRLPVVAGLMLSDDDRLRADVINRLMCYDEVPFAEVEHAHHMRFRDYFAEELKRLEAMAADGLVEIGVDRLRVLPRGRFLLRNLAMTFDAYLPRQPAGPRFSQVL
jgi:oxygen-independent coproporphyrinogen-3 oxidase